MKLFVHQLDNLNNYIQIDLLDNPVITRWFDHCVSLQEISCNIYKQTVGSRPKRDSSLSNHVRDQYQSLIDNINQLKQSPLPIIIDFPEIPKFFNFDQHWCNHVHNIFVALIRHLELNVSHHDRYSNAYYIKIETIAKNINSIIHDLEYDAYQTLSAKFFHKHYPHSYLQTFIQTSKKLDNAWFTITPKEQQLYHSSNHTCNVVFGNNILGKTYFVSFLQEEKVDSPAVSGITGTWGDIEILLDNNRKSIYNSTQFKLWLAKTAPKTMPTNGWSWQRRIPIPLDFPVGNVHPSCNLKSFANNRIHNKQFVYKFAK